MRYYARIIITPKCRLPHTTVNKSNVNTFYLGVRLNGMQAAFKAVANLHNNTQINNIDFYWFPLSSIYHLACVVCCFHASTSACSCAPCVL